MLFSLPPSRHARHRLETGRSSRPTIRRLGLVTGAVLVALTASGASSVHPSSQVVHPTWLSAASGDADADAMVEAGRAGSGTTTSAGVSRSEWRAQSLQRAANVTQSQSDAVAVAHAQDVAEAEAAAAAAAAAAQAAQAAHDQQVAAAQADPRGAAATMVSARGWGSAQFSCLNSLWTRESGWNYTATNASSGAYGIPQSLPASKLATAGDDWQTNPLTQITWGLDYITRSYGSPCQAWAHSEGYGWY